MNTVCSFSTSQIFHTNIWIYCYGTKDGLAEATHEDSKSTVSSVDTTYTSMTELDVPFQPVRNGEVILFSINIRRTCEAFGIPFDSLLQQEVQSFSPKKYAAVVDKVRSNPFESPESSELIFRLHSSHKINGVLATSGCFLKVYPNLVRVRWKIKLCAFQYFRPQRIRSEDNLCT